MMGKGRPAIAIAVLDDLKKKRAASMAEEDGEEEGSDLEAQAQKCVDAKDGAEFLAALRPLVEAITKE